MSGVRCESQERLVRHVHAHLFVLLDGKPQAVPAQIGIPAGALGLPKCFCWLHAHDETGVIHIEAPDERPFTLGQLFDVWGQPLQSGRVGLWTLPGSPAGSPGGSAMTTYVDGRPYEGDPRLIRLDAHTQIVIELGRTVSPPTFRFPAGE